MRREFLGLLSSPCCGEVLTMTARETDPSQGEVRSGTLSCPCGQAYGIERGVPDLVAPASRGDSCLRDNAALWSFLWAKLRGLAPSFVTSRELFQQDFGVADSDIAGKAVLEAGIGTGKFIPYLLDAGARIVVGLDIADTIHETYDRLAPGSGGRLCLVRCDLRRMPLRRDAFDIALSSRVLHHLPDMGQALRALLGSVRGGGRVAVVVYARRPGLDRLIRAAESAKPALRRALGLRGLYHASIIPAAAVFACLRCVYRPARRFAPGLAGRLPLARVFADWDKLDFQWLWRYVIFDQLAAPSTRYLSEPELLELAASLPASSVEHSLQSEAMWNFRLVRESVEAGSKN